MGFELDRFNCDVDPDLTCNLCNKILEDPLATPCGHVFCAGCVIPWVSKQKSCPSLCQRISTKELNYVLPLKNLILKLDIRCDNHGRGCEKVVKLQRLAEHVGMCEFSPTNCRNKGCKAVLNLKDVDAHMREQCEYRPIEICQNGCGLMVTLNEKRSSDHCCLKSLKTHNGALQVQLISSERELKRQSLRFSKREESLLSQLSAVHSELQMTALKYQQKFTEYNERIDSLSRRQYTLHNGSETQSIKVTLRRESGSLGFNIIGGRGREESSEECFTEGIVVSKIVESGPADRGGGLQIHDRILEVNGRDLSQASHEEAVEVFRLAEEPIEVKVLRVEAPTTSPAPALPSLLPVDGGVDSSTQTDITLGQIQALAALPAPAPALAGAILQKYLFTKECQMPNYPMCHPSGAGFLGGLQTELREELVYEEVELQRPSSSDKLGLTLCYRTDQQNQTGIYVSEVDPKSIAAKDGRVREGDQIIQVNGVEVQHHEEAVALLGREEGSRAVCLLIARPESQFQDAWLDATDRDCYLDDTRLDMLEQLNHEAMQFTASMLQQMEHEDGVTTDTATLLSNRHEKDSGVGRTDESTRNEESSEQENLTEDLASVSNTPGTRRSHAFSLDTLGSRDMRISQDSFFLFENGESDSLGFPDAECERFRNLLELKYLLSAGSDSSSGSPSHSPKAGEEPGTLDFEDEEIQTLNEELQNIELECLSIIRAHRMQAAHKEEASAELWAWREGKPEGSADGDRLRLKGATGECEEVLEKDGSCGYHTETSGFRTPLKASAAPCAAGSSNRTFTTAERSEATHNLLPCSTSANVPLSPIQEPSPTQINPPCRKSEPSDQTSGVKVKRVGSDKKSSWTTSPRSPCGPVHIPAHAQHYQSYMQLVQQKSAVEYGQSQASLASAGLEPRASALTRRAKLEWKVKIRSDGSRYITKRPSREQLLRDRAMRIKEERSGLTTDDDAASELKLGRYWSKEERKQHAARSREQRQRREQMKQDRTDPEQGGNTDDKREPDIIQLSHRKMMRRRNKKIFDNWMTIQELLAHGTRSQDGTQLDNALLSVTTV